MKNSYLTATDQFCGAGGSGQGIESAGVEVKQALNHWKLATETYETNFPKTSVACTDISACDPRRYASTNILVTSPECTVHSPAGGNHYKAVKKQMDMFAKGEIDPAAERSRATMWDVCRFAEYHNYEIVVVENVVEALTRWALFDVWLMAMHKLGYEHKLLFLNSMHHHPTPQSRDRMYIVFWKKGNKTPDLDFTPKAHCANCSKDVRAYQWWKNSDRKFGKYRTQYLYRCTSCTEVVEPFYHASFNIIDWSIPGKPVMVDGEPQYRPNTIRRIQYGLEKFGHQHLLIGSRYKSGFECRVHSQEDPIPTQTSMASHGIVTPMIIGHYYSGNKGTNIKPMDQPLPTQTGSSEHSIVTPFFMTTEHSKVKAQSAVRSGVDASRTQTTTDGQGVVMPAPFIVENNGQSKARQVDKPISAITTREKHGILTPKSLNAFLTYYYGSSSQYSQMTDPAFTMSTRDRAGLVTHESPTLEDCLYRTIRPHEVKKAMAFGDDYQVLGNGKQIVKQCGNAVTPPVMEWIIGQCVKSLS